MEPQFHARCTECGVDIDSEVWFTESGGLCGECLAGYGVGLTRIGADDYPLRHPVTGRFMAGDCERDCLEHCAGLCGAF